jgi:hypothetical protein
MNAFKALTYPEMEIGEFINTKPVGGYGKSKWAYLVRTCPQSIDILAGTGIRNYISTIQSTRTDDVLFKQFVHIFDMAFDILSDNEHQFETTTVAPSAVEQVDYAKCVVITAIDKLIATSAGNRIGDHFICIVGMDNGRYHIDCSSTQTAVGEKYQEYYDKDTGRYFNNTIAVADINEMNLGAAAAGIRRIARTK